jgi:hypothetical protein
MRTFPIFEIAFVRGSVRVRFALHFNVSFNGGALGAVQAHLARLSLVIVAFPEETPVVATDYITDRAIRTFLPLLRIEQIESSPCATREALERRG